jgi:uncharacterized Tic20 family protein
MTAHNDYSQEERLLAAIAHASVIMGAIGPVVGLLVYITQKEKSAYAAGQGLQAAIYQLVGRWFMILVLSCWFGFYMLTLIPVINAAEQSTDAPPPIFWVGLLSMICPFIVMGLWMLYGLYGAVRTWTGADFRYAVIGRMVEEHLETA